jgi:hypothetical protein
MKSLTILLCGGDAPALQRKAEMLAADGITVKISTDLINNLCFSQEEWDLLLVDLDGLNSFLRSVLPAVSRNFPNLPMVGLSTKTGENINPLQLGYGLELDDYLFEAPKPEDLIVRFPQVAARYLCDTGSLAPPGTHPFAN